MKHRPGIGSYLLSIPFGLAITAGTAGAADWHLDLPHSELVVQTFIAGIASRFGHDHVVHATEVTGQLQFDPEAGTGTLQMTVHTASLKADEPRLRAKYKLDKVLDADEIAQVEHAMKGEDQLDVKRYPTMTFQSLQLHKQPDGSYLVDGKLTIHGRTQQVHFPAQVDVRGDRMAAKAQLRFKQSSFGYEPYSAMLGALKLKDEALMTVLLVATRTP